MAVRVLITIATFLLTFVALHLLTVFIVTWLVIPRLRPGSQWSREVDAYMATIFPGKW
jgi:cell division protein FtsX